MKIDDSILSKLTDEQRQKVEAAQTPEELLSLAKDLEYELTEEQLDSVAGGKWCGSKCAHCSHGSCKEECTLFYPCGDFCMKY